MSLFCGYEEDKVEIKDPPTENDDVSSKKYADTKLALSGGTMTEDIDMNSNSLTGIPTPANNSNAISK